MNDPGELLALALRLVDEVTPVLVRSRGQVLATSTKSSDTDMVTEMDQWCERHLVTAIAAERPDDGVIGEEGADRPGTSGVCWVIDPIDGTTNYLYDVPGYSVSIAAEIDGRPAVAVVADPVRREVFTAVAGQGATRNGAPLACSTAAEPATALVGTGFGYRPERRRAQAETLTQVLPSVRDIRRMGGAALDLCAVAAGRLDAYYEAGLARWDIAAGALIAAEAGAVVSDIDGRWPVEGFVVAANPVLHPPLLSLLTEAEADRD